MNIHCWKDIDYRGTIVRVDYEAAASDGTPWLKYANVYLPYGYDDNRPYNVLYLIHGGGGNPDAWLDCSQIKNVFDRSFYEKRAEPFIAVFPCFYNLIPSTRKTEGVDSSFENSQVRSFQKELAQNLLPAVEGRFHTYSDGTQTEALKASRDHRAIGGFSMGACTTWYAFIDNLDYFSTFIPLSGDCWIVEPTGGREHAEKTAQILADRAKEAGYTNKDLRIFAATGREDIAYPNLTPQIEAMKAYPEIFDFSEDISGGNFHYIVKENSVHAYEEVYHHVWNYIPYLFQ